MTQASMQLQRCWGQAAGTARNLTLAGLLVLEQRGKLPGGFVFVSALGLVFALGVAARQRRRPAPGVSLGRLDFELSSLSLVALVQLVCWAPGGLEGPCVGLLYAGFALICAFARPLASLASWAFVACLLLALPGPLQAEVALRHATLAFALGLSGGATWLSLRTLVERARHSEHQSVDRELARLREAARSYRLLPETEAERVSATPPRAGLADAVSQEDPRLLRSSVEEIHAALRSCLSVCRAALGCRSVLLWWLDESGAWLHLRGSSSSEPETAEGPLSAREGIFAAALESSTLVELVGASLTRPLPYYRVSPPAGSPPVGHAGALA
ncbi:MAG TPA: hypothetical protein VJU61_28475, partial [Polyangiaceae bacterium]|nr:hypothetical protein [Polyangiaceae bacterium]